VLASNDSNRVESWHSNGGAVAALATHSEFDFEILKMFKQRSEQQSAGTDGSKNSHISGKCCCSLQTLLQHCYLLMMVG